MRHLAKIVVLVVMTAVGGSSLGASLLLQAQPDQRPAGCHEHGSKAPAPESTSYQCCLTGHNSALPQTSQSPEPIVHNIYNVHSELVIESPMSSLVAFGFKNFAVSSGDPPGTPLRI
jgi:hypothetical protein